MGASAVLVLPVALAWACLPGAAIGFDRDGYQYQPGETVTVLGRAFAPSSQVALTLQTPSASSTTVGNGVFTDTSGNFRDSFTLPASAAPGAYVVLATVNTTDVDGHGRTYATRESFSVMPPPGTGPAQTSWGGLTASGTSTTAADTTAPGVLGYGVTNGPFVVGGEKTPQFGFAARRHKKGTTFTYTLSEAATVRIVIFQRRAGRRKGIRCVAPRRSLRKKAKCTMIIRKGTLTRISHQGANRVGFSGRIGSKALSPGSYSATITATDAAKNTSGPKTISFTIVKR